MFKQEEIERIERYLAGLSDDKEKDWVESQFSNGENNSSLHDLLKNDWNLLLKDTSSSDIHLSHILDRIHHIIRKNEINISNRPLQKFIRIYAKAAAILLLPILVAGGLLYWHMEYVNTLISEHSVVSTIFAPMGSRVSFGLPDGTTGMLNSGSSLSYSLPFLNNRNVKLEGEAWFEVNNDEDHPFEINTGNSAVKVLGTSFNLSAYPTENYVEVVLKEGKVEFQDNSIGEKVMVLPSERMVLQEGKISKSVTEPEKYYSWTKGKLVFRSDPMAEVARRIERWYNVRIIIADKELEKYSFRATFEDDKLEDVLRFISMTSPIRYEITPRELMPDGTYKKEEVTIYLK